MGIEIMSRLWKFGAFAVLVFCLGVIEVVAGETTKVEFDGWTVSITPRIQAAGKVKSQVDSAVAAPSPAEPEKSRSSQQGIAVRPASYQQVDPAPLPSPIPEPPQLNQTVAVEAPMLSNTASSLASGSQHSAPCTDCGPPILIPRAGPQIIKEQPVVPQAMNYKDIYFAIPFNRAEYNANPSYRHEATMEILFNQLRPTVIQRSTSNVYQYNYGNNGAFGYPYGNATYPFYPYGYPYLLLHTY